MAKYSNKIKIKQTDGTFEDVRISYIGSNNSTEEGIGTQAVAPAQHVEGTYNMPISAIDNATVLHVVGNGVGPDAQERSNAYVLNANGTGIYTGGLLAQNITLTDEELLKKLVNGENANVTGRNLADFMAGYDAFYEEYGNYTNIVKTQLDAKANTWYYTETEMNEEMQKWNTNELKQQHIGDLWYKVDGTDKLKTYVYTTDFSWEEFDGVPQAVFDTFDGKAQLFVSKPSQYNKNDIWILDIDNPEYATNTSYPGFEKGTFLVATASRGKNEYAVSDWIELVKYSEAIKTLSNQIDKKLQTWRQKEDPKTTVSNWVDAEHEGDYWYNSDTNKIKKYVAYTVGTVTSYEWRDTNDKIPTHLWDAIDGKKAIYTSLSTEIKPDNGDLLIPEQDILYNSITYLAGHIYKYENNNWKETAYAEMIEDVRGLADGKTEVWNSKDDPSNKWVTKEEKDDHLNDLWIETDTGVIRVWSWLEEQNKYDWIVSTADLSEEWISAIGEKASIYVENPSTYAKADIYILETKRKDAKGDDCAKGEMLIANTSRTTPSNTYNAAHWDRKIAYTDDTLAESVQTIVQNWGYGNDTTTIDGGKIQTHTIAADRIEIDTLSALSANLGTVTAGVIQSKDYGQTVTREDEYGFTRTDTLGVQLDLDNQTFKTPGISLVGGHIGLDDYLYVGSTHLAASETVGIGKESIIMGNGCKVNDWSIAAGFSVSATGKCSAAFNCNSTASGEQSFAANRGSASKLNSAAFNKGSATAECSFAIGQDTRAGGSYSFAAGESAHADGTCSFSMGNNTEAQQYLSYAIGDCTISDSANQIVFGRYNKIDDSNTYAVIMGNGTATTDAGRKNGYTLDWNGNGVYNGTVKAAGFLNSDGTDISSLYLPLAGGTMKGDIDATGYTVTANKFKIGGSGVYDAWITNHDGDDAFIRFYFAQGDSTGYQGSVILTNTGSFYPYEKGPKHAEGFALGKNNATEYWATIAGKTIWGDSIKPGSFASTKALGASDKAWDVVWSKTFRFSEKPGTTSTSTAPNTRIAASSTYQGTYNIIYSTTESSKTIKHDIQLLNDEQLKAEKLYNLNVYQAKYNDDILAKDDCRYLKTMPMFLIEEMAEIYPIAVDKNTEDVATWGWNSHYLIPPMLKLIQDQKKQLDNQQSEIDILKEQLLTLSEKIDNLL